MSRMRKAIAMMLVVLLAAAQPLALMAAYRDTQGSPAEKQIEKWSQLNILSGYTDSTFKPEQLITNAELAAVLCKTFNLPEGKGLSFSDVEPNQWYSGYVQKVSAYGIMAGKEGKFYPDALVTRAEAVLAMARALDKAEKNEGVSVQFLDVTALPVKDRQIIQGMVDKGYIRGKTDALFAPNDGLTRAEMVQFLDKTAGELVSAAGEYSADAQGNLMINTAGVILKDMTVEGNVYVTPGVREGSVALQHVTVKGDIINNGGRSISFTASRVEGVLQKNKDILVEADKDSFVGAIVNLDANGQLIVSTPQASLKDTPKIIVENNFSHSAPTPAPVPEPTPAPLKDEEIMDMLYRNSYAVFEEMRYPNGVYRDSILLNDWEPYHPSSVAATGMGLMTLAIADRKGWDDQALEKAILTLKTMTGRTEGFAADRAANGYFRHFIDLDNGQQAWGAEYSTIDSAILVTGALFAKNYFNDAELSVYVDELYNSIDFQEALADLDTGAIYLIMEGEGTGRENALTLPYNEYIIVAWLAYLQHIDEPDSLAVQMWDKWFAAPDMQKKKAYEQYELLTDHDERYLPSFTLQFPYYMINMFSQSEEYTAYVINGYRADKLWSQNTGEMASYEWGNGAGNCKGGYGYHADAINDNEELIVSPHIISGYLPVNADGINDLLALYKNRKGVYQLPANGKEILWRYSIEDPDWKSDSLQAVDYSTLVFGLAAHDSRLGMDFFRQNAPSAETVLPINPIVKEVPVIAEAPIMEEIPVADEISVTDETPEIDEISVTDETPEIDEVSVADEAPGIEEVIVTDEAPAVDEAS